jgi:predicted RNA methylase
MIGVSDATIRNWVKAGYLKPSSERPLQFLEEDALSLKTKLVTGSLGRLRTRANKIKSQSTSIPKEYSKHADSLLFVERVTEIFRRERLDIGRTMYFAALRLLELHGEVARDPGSSIFGLWRCGSFKRQAVEFELSQWYSDLGSFSPNAAYELVYSRFIPKNEGDPLGLLYQSLCSEGQKSNVGSYYTPSSVVESAIAHSGFAGATFLDPCCGTGSYLLSAARILNLVPEQIYGIDSDDIAARIARLNVLLAYPDHNMAPKISCANALTEVATGEMFCDSNHLIGQIDFIATNPPWGAFKNSTLLAPLELLSNSSEAFSLFLVKSLMLLKKGGRLSFLLPESILRIKTHSPIRKHLLSHTRIIRIVKLGRVFSGVFTPVVRIDLIKDQADTGWRVSIEDSKGSAIEVDQARFLSNADYDFDVEVNEDADQVLKNIYSVEHVTLAGNATWALGVVTGENKKYLSSSREFGMEPIYRGSDVYPFKLGPPKTFVHFSPDTFQQVAREWIYRAPEKLVYKFISSSLVFAYDDQGSLTLNSANILIPALPGISTKIALAFLNSHVFQYIFKKRSTHKILRGDLEKLPFPSLSREQANQIEAMVDTILAGAGAPEQLQEFLFQVFGLSTHDVELIRSTVKGR